MFKAIMFLSITTWMVPATIAAASPRETAEAFLGHVLAMEVQQAIMLISEPDQSAPVPLGRYNAFVTNRPRFPSRWSFEVVSVEEQDGSALVDIAIKHPEIENSLRRTSSAALEELALQHYLSGDLEITRTEIEVSLIELDTGQWGVRTFADEDDWWRQRRTLPEANVMAMNRGAIVNFQNQLMERFPHRAAEVSALVDPELAMLDAAAGLTFSNLNVVDDRTREQRRFREPAYDISLGVTNGSAHTITRISGQLIFRNNAGEIIDTSIWIFSDRDVPAGLQPRETFSSTSGVRIENLDAEVATVEVQISDITIR